ncbi:MAG: hypothetical protein DWH86_01740 [Planctomycetota bacterium]|nr:MAG: hypothetical protein DWH86_01740 [Planctomycetota bacterium]
MSGDAEKFDSAVDSADADHGLGRTLESSLESPVESGVTPRSPFVAITASTIVHALIALGLVAMGITAARAMRREAPPILVAEWTPPPPAGIAPAPPELPIPGGALVYQGPAARGVHDAGSGARAAADRLERLAPPIPVTATAAGRFDGPLGFGGALPERFRAASFAMDKQRVAFLIDGGGRLLSALPAARPVLAQRLAALTPNQQFTVAIARGSGVELAPGTPASATRANTAAALRWFTERSEPGGTPDLGAALDRVWRTLEPDAVCVIARGTPTPLRTAARSANATLLSTADRLNPKNADGSRIATFLCVELVETSADGALRALGERHGGSTGYLLLDRATLGLAPMRSRNQPAGTISK